MKNTTKIVAVSALLTAGFTGVASAHDVANAVGNSTTAARTDVFDVECYAGTAYFTVSVRDTKTTPEKATKVSIQASKGGVTTALSTDTTDTDTLFSATKTLSGGTGVYRVTVNKNSVAGVTGAEGYTARIHCYDANGQHNPDDQSDPVWIQNQ
jgi:hypothetical protein